jgi:D-sedoheptulose 7-phosphate isomerase
MSDASDVLTTTISDTIALHQRVAHGDLEPVLDAARAIAAAFRNGSKLLIFGNGGSASDAQHMAAEFVGRFLQERAALSAVALTTDTSVLTSIGNDYAFDRIFARQIEALGRPGDVAFGISTSGGSPNVVEALEAADRRGLTTIALTGRCGGAVGRAAGIHINVPSNSTPRVQEVHRTLLHVVCDLVERAAVADARQLASAVCSEESRFAVAAGVEANGTDIEHQSAVSVTRFGW